MNQVLVRTDKGEYLPGETVCGAVYLDIKNPTEAHGVQISFKGRELVCCECSFEVNRETLQASHDYVDYCNADLYQQKDPFGLGSYCFPFRLQIPYVIPGTFQASKNGAGKSWSACVSYQLKVNIVGADAMVAEQDIVVKSVTPEALRDNLLTQACDIQVPNPLFGFGKKMHITIKPVCNYFRTGESARLKLVITNPRKARPCSFIIRLVRTLTLTLPYRPRPTLEASSDHGEEAPCPGVQQHTVLVEGGRTVIREMTGDLSHCNTASLASGTSSGLDNIRIPLKSTDGKNLMPAVNGKHIQCQYYLEVSLNLGDNNIQTVTCPIVGVLPEENAQWLLWKPLPWMNTTQVKLSNSPGPVTPPQQLLGSEAFSRLPGFQEL